MKDFSVLCVPLVELSKPEYAKKEFQAVKNHCINPVDSREASAEKPETLVTEFDEPDDIKVFEGFKDMPEDELKELRVCDVILNFVGAAKRLSETMKLFLDFTAKAADIQTLDSLLHSASQLADDEASRVMLSFVMNCLLLSH